MLTIAVFVTHKMRNKVKSTDRIYGYTNYGDPYYCSADSKNSEFKKVGRDF